MPDMRDHPVEVPTVTRTSPHREVEVVVAEGKLRSVRFDHLWLQAADPFDVEDILTATANEALVQWTTDQLLAVQNATPDMVQLHAAITAAQTKLQDTWVATLAQVKRP